MQSNFREWTLDKIDETFGLRQVYEMDTLNQLITPSYELNDFEKQYIGTLDRKSTRLNSSHVSQSRIPSSA